nr:unnamed protein product [Digitaria exilis]
MDASSSGSNSGLRLRLDDDMPPPPPVSAALPGLRTIRALPGENFLDATDSLELSMELYGRSTLSLSTSPGFSLLVALLFPEQRWSGLFSFPGVFFRLAADLLGDGRAMAMTLAGDQRPGLDGFFAGDPAAEASASSSSPAMISQAFITSRPESGLLLPAPAAGFLSAVGTTSGGGRMLARFHSLLIGLSCGGGGCSFSGWCGGGAVLGVEVEDAVGGGGEGDDVVDAAAHRGAPAAGGAAAGPRREELRGDAPHRLAAAGTRACVCSLPLFLSACLTLPRYSLLL